MIEKEVQDREAQTRALLKRCCGGHCNKGTTHECERRPAVRYSSVAEPGSLDAVGPLHPKVQSRLRRIAGRRETVDNRVQLLADGVQSYGAMLDLVESAKNEILFENFIFRSDAVGTAFAGVLRERSASGAEVRVLHDPFGSLMSRRLPIGFRFHGSAARVRAYNPPRPTPAFFRWGRDHRKLVIQDRARLVTGGMCLADVWLGNCVERCTWRDSAVEAEGGVAAEAAAEFDRMWDRGISFTPGRPNPRSPGGLWVCPDQPADGGAVPVRLWTDEPGERRIERMLVEVIESANREVLVTNPYFLPTHEIARALRDAAGRGVEVQVVVPGTNNHRIVGLSAEHGFGTLLAAGVRVWRWRGPMIHAKTAVVDRAWSFVGSSNLDALSLRRNAELNLEIHGSRFAEQVADLFLRDVEGSTSYQRADWNARSPGRRWLTRLMARGGAWQ